MLLFLFVWLCSSFEIDLALALAGLEASHYYSLQKNYNNLVTLACAKGPSSLSVYLFFLSWDFLWDCPLKSSQNAFVCFKKNLKHTYEESFLWEPSFVVLDYYLPLLPFLLVNVPIEYNMDHYTLCLAWLIFSKTCLSMFTQWSKGDSDNNCHKSQLTPGSQGKE